jgi:hypothetical protein
MQGSTGKQRVFSGSPATLNSTPSQWRTHPERCALPSDCLESIPNRVLIMKEPSERGYRFPTLLSPQHPVWIARLWGVKCASVI